MNSTDEPAKFQFHTMIFNTTIFDYVPCRVLDLPVFI